MKPIRVGVLTPSLILGGAANSLYNLIYWCDPDRVTFTGIAATRPVKPPYNVVPELDHLRGRDPVPIYGVLECETPEPFQSVRRSEDAVRMVAKDADLLLAWGPCGYRKNLCGIDVPLVLTCRGGIGCEYTAEVMEEGLPFAHHHVAVSEDALWHFPETVRRQVEIIPNTVNPNRVREINGRDWQREQWGVKSGQKVVGYLGRVSSEKNVVECVAAAQMLPDDWILAIIAPEYTQRYAYHQKVQAMLESRLPNRHVWTSPGTFVGDPLRALDVMLTLSPREGCGNSVIEAWHVGCPVVYRPVGIARQMGRSLNVGWPVRDADDVTATEVAYGILKLYASPHDSVQGGHKAAGQLSIENHVRLWADFLERCLDE